jgi:alkaline phosphatase
MLFIFSAILLGAALLFGQPVAGATANDSSQSPRQVILIIGDGMDEQQIAIARNYLKGARGRLLLDQLPLRASAQVLTIRDEVDGKHVYVADSANTATSMATGEVTSRGRLATTAGDDRDIETIVELASAAGLRTGLVSTASVTDATPASFASHLSLRYCENPERMIDITISGVNLGSCPADTKAGGGLGSVAEQLAASKLDVILGGGLQHFQPLAEGEAVPVLEIARNNGFQLATSPGELAAAADDARLLGLFAESHLPVRMIGADDRAAEEPDPSLLNMLHPYLGDVDLPEPMTCEPNPLAGGVPTLQQMTDKALALLSRANDRGFFLMIESASIDKESHERRPCGSIGELEQLEEALASALAFADKHPNTLVLVTSDHTQAAQLIPYESLFSKFPIPIYSPGHIARIITPEGGLMTVNYATNNFAYEEHTGAAVPLYSNAEGRDRIPSFIQQPELFRICMDYLGLGN